MKNIQHLSLAFASNIVLMLLCFCHADAQPSTNKNYIATTTIKQAGITTEAQITALSISATGKTEVIQYQDGFGKPIQTIITKGSATGKDIVTPVEYDAFGREVKKLLPYVDITGTAPGAFKTGAIAAQGSFYSGSTLQGVAPDALAFSMDVLEASPLRRTLASGAPGTSWQPNAANPYDATKKILKKAYLINTVNDKIRRWDFNYNTGSFTSPGLYNAGKLYVQIDIDEKGDSIKEYKDLDGLTVLKRVQDSVNSWIETYYVYDQLHQLRAVIQPQGAALLPASGVYAPTAELLSKWCFLYRYDQRGRMVMKKMPGADSMVMIYDRWDRLVLTQDGNQRTKSTKEWSFTKYDNLNRPIVTGIVATNATHEALRQAADSSTVRFENINTAVAEGYTLTLTYPTVLTEVLTITHYDSYDQLPTWKSDYAFVSENGNSTHNKFVTGQSVATQVKQLGQNVWLRTVNYYDDKYRVIQTSSNNIVAGKDRITKKLFFDGKPESQWHTHSSSFYTTPVVTKQTYAYDHADRLLSVKHQFAGLPEITMAENTYNELGQLITKRLHKAGAGPELQKLDYGYNIRGWLTHINRVENTAGVIPYEAGDLFAMELGYNITGLPTSTAQYNGNIAEQRWKGPLAEVPEGFVYNYDKTSRITNALFADKSTDVWAVNNRHDERGLTYDKNGNIRSLVRMENGNTLDNLSYSYSGNQLWKVEDAGNATSGFKNGVNATQEYYYDANGNMLKDDNKGIASISYNVLNLPQLITITGKGTIQYSYDASGNKLSKKVTDQTKSPAVVTITYYGGNFIYTKTDTAVLRPELILHEEGRLRPKRINPSGAFTANNLTYIYDYFLKDHLGNTRLVITTETQADIYKATLEDTAITKEAALFDNVTATKVPKPTGYDADANNKNVSKINAATQRIGLKKLLKVMAGDKISMQTESWYKETAGACTECPNLGAELLNAMVNDILTTGGKAGLFTSTQMNSVLSPQITNFMSRKGYNAAIPKAYINYMLLDENCKVYQSGAYQIPIVTAGSQRQVITPLVNMQINKHGYVYLFLSNESKSDVYFDNLAINHTRGPVLEETHYYPFGVAMAGISSIAAGKPENKQKKFQGQEFSDELDVDMYEFKYRMHDPQIGRFWQVDPLADKYVHNSTYAFSENKVISHVELEGLESFSIQDLWRSAGITSSTDPKEFVSNVAKEVTKPSTWFAGAAAAGQIAGSALVGIFTEGLFAGSLMAAETRALSSAPEIASTTAAETAELSLAERAAEIHSALPSATQSRTTTAVASATTSEGTSTTLVASSEIRLRPAQRAILKPGEVAVTGKGHAEVTILNHAKANGITVNSVAASRPICSNCATAISNAGASSASPLKEVKAISVDPTRIKSPVILPQNR